MTDFAVFMKDKPSCFGKRQNLLPNPNDCKSCSAARNCFSMQRAVIDAVIDNKIDNTYSQSERKSLVYMHSAFCMDHGLDRFKKYPLDLVMQFHHHFFPDRSHEEVILAELLQDFCDPESSTTPKAHPAIKLHSSSASNVAVETKLTLPSSATSSTAKLTVTPGSAMAILYSFPMPMTRAYSTFSNADLVDTLNNLTHAAFHANPAKGYLTVREKFCAIHIEMNHRQQHAPRFRKPNPLSKAITCDVERLQALDRQVIDLHWIAFSSQKPSSPANNYPTLFNNAPFDLAASEKFAQEKWPVTAKSVHLHLGNEMQWELAIIQCEEIRKQWRDIDQGSNQGKQVTKAGAPHIECRLRNAIRQINKPQIAHSIPGMVSAWKARKIVGNGSAKIARMVAMMTGEEIRDPSAMSKTLLSLDKYLALIKTTKKP